MKRLLAPLTGRHKDNRGVDGVISAFAPFGQNDGYLHSVDIDVQLKATKQQPAQTETHFSYRIKSVEQYDMLRSDRWGTPRILVVMFLPDNSDSWLSHSPERLLLRRCAYWVSLHQAGPCTNKNQSGQTIHLPKQQCLDVANLRALCSLFSHRNFPPYQSP